MDTAPNVAALPSDLQSNGASNFDKILALIGAISLSPGDAQRLTIAIHNCVDSSGDTEDNSGSVSKEISSQVPAPAIITTASSPTASSPTPATPPAPALVVADEPAAAPVQVKEAADPNPVLPEAPATLPAHPVAPAIPAEHFTTSHCGILFLLPLHLIPGPYYLITKGRSIGVVADWSQASPLVTGIKGAVFHKVSSVGLRLQSMLSAINCGTVEYL